MYDIIGDIHGYADHLKQLLTKMGYTNEKGLWSHPERKAIFVGDFIDRGPGIKEVLSIVRNMFEHEKALAVMGNHEYNAIAFAHQREDGSFLRSHNATHTKQHQATLDQFADSKEEWKEWISWFKGLPLYLDLKDIRIVHACWDQEHINWLNSNYAGKLTDEHLVAAHRKGSLAHTVIEETLKGKEINIPEHCAWADKDGHLRTSNRIKWWVDPNKAKHEEFLFNCPDILKGQPIPPDIAFNLYPFDAPPVFFGHYWLEDKWPVIQSDNVICLDYSVAKGGNLVAYRWTGEKVLNQNNFVSTH